MRLPVMRPRLPSVEQVSSYLTSMDASGVYSNYGPLVTALESRIGSRLGIPADRIVVVANATLGIQGALAAQAPSRWLVPVYTFAATGQAVLGAGKEICFRDIDADTWCLSQNQPENGPDVGILPVMPFGAPVDLHQWHAFDHVVVDAAASLGAEPLDLANMPGGWAVVFSLHATKVLPAGEGGVVACGSASMATWIRTWTNFGFGQDRLSMVQGTNAKMSEITAAYGLASLDHWDIERAQWLEALAKARLWNIRLGVDGPPALWMGARPYWMAQFASNAQRNRVEETLARQGIETRRWWPQLLSEMPAFRQSGKGTSFPVARHVCDTILGLPLFREMSSEDVDRVGTAVEGALA